MDRQRSRSVRTHRPTHSAAPWAKQNRRRSRPARRATSRRRWRAVSPASISHSTPRATAKRVGVQRSLIGSITTALTSRCEPADAQALNDIHAALTDHKLLPAEHLLDAGYVDRIRLLESRPLSIKLLGPVPRDGSWQARTEGAFDTTCCAIDWAQEQARCPQHWDGRNASPASDHCAGYQPDSCGCRADGGATCAHAPVGLCRAWSGTRHALWLVWRRLTCS